MVQTMTWVGLDVHARSTHAAAVDALPVRPPDLEDASGHQHPLGGQHRLVLGKERVPSGKEFGEDASFVERQVGDPGRGA